MNIFFILSHRKSPTYQVVIKTTDNKNGLQENTLTYNCTLTVKEITLKGYIVRIQRSDILLNDTQEQSPVNELSLITGGILSDLELGISQYGKILRIKNYPDIRKKWEMTKLRMENAYKGEMVEKMISSMDKTFQNQQTTISSLEKDPFFYNFLMGVYGKYTNGKRAHEGLLWGMSDTPVKVVKHSELRLDDEDTVSIEFSTRIMPESLEVWQAELSVIRGTGVLDISLTGNYRFLSGRRIRSIDTCFESYWDQQLLKRIEFTINLQEQ